MNCPKDADTTSFVYFCKARDSRNYYCTRVEGHKGKHHEHDIDGKCLAVWGD